MPEVHVGCEFECAAGHRFFGALEGQVPVGGDRSQMKPAIQPGSKTAAVA